MLQSFDVEARKKKSVFFQVLAKKHRRRRRRCSSSSSGSAGVKRGDGNYRWSAGASAPLQKVATNHLESIAPTARRKKQGRAKEANEEGWRGVRERTQKAANISCARARYFARLYAFVKIDQMRAGSEEGGSEGWRKFTRALHARETEPRRAMTAFWVAASPPTSPGGRVRARNMAQEERRCAARKTERGSFMQCVCVEREGL